MSPSPVSSNPMLRVALIGGLGVGVAVIVAAAIVGMIVAGGQGAASGAVGGAVGALFPALTAISLLLANRFYGTPSYLQILFAVVLGTWLVKIVLVVIALIVLLNQDWVQPLVFFVALVAAAVGSLVVDLVAMQRMRLSGASDVELPQSSDEP